MLGRLKFEIDELVNEMLDQLPEEVFKSKTTTFLDPCMGGGQFVKEVEARLRKYGHSDANIAKRVFGVEDDVLSVTYAVKRHNLVGQYFLHKNYLEYNETMKFDVVIGNPPYDDGTVGKANIWDKFTLKSLSLADHVAMVVPFSMGISEHSGNGEVRKAILEHGVRLVSYVPFHYFPYVKVQTMYFVASRSYRGTTIIKTTAGEKFPYDHSGFFFRNKYTSSIVKKIDKFFDLKIKAPKNTEKQKKFVKMVSNINPSGIETEDKTNYASPDIRSWRVVTSYLNNGKPSKGTFGDLLHLKASHVLKPGIAVPPKYRYFVCQSKTEAENLASFLQTDFCNFLWLTTKTSRTLDNPQIRFLPYVDLSQPWTDKKLQKRFNLTQEEIQYIKETVG